MAPPDIKDEFKVGSKCIVCQDADLRGKITIGPGSILHPRCTVLAVSGPIVIGAGCIVEENAVILNRSKTTMTIGDNNLFQVGCRVESPTIGDHNVFGLRSRVTGTVSIGSHCSIGAGCTVLPSPFQPNAQNHPSSPPPPVPSKSPNLSFTTPDSDSPPPPPALEVGMEPQSESSGMDVDTSLPPPPPSDTSMDPPSSIVDEQTTSPTAIPATTEILPDFTVVYGGESKRRLWSSEGQVQKQALHVKHLAYLSETLPKFHRLKVFV